MSLSALNHMAEHERKPMLNDDELLRWRDGREHRIGPLTLRYLGPGEHGPEGEARIKTEDASFTLGWMDAEAIAFCIAPSADLWNAHESDREPQPMSGERRGWLRLVVTESENRLGGLTGWKGATFQIARLVTDCGEHEQPERFGERTTDYSRRFTKGPSRAAQAETRMSFIQACSALARSRNPDLPENWAEMAKARWQAADDVETATRLEKGLDQ